MRWEQNKRKSFLRGKERRRKAFEEMAERSL